MTQANLTFSPWRAFLWPVRASELRKFLPLFLMAFFIGFNYNVLKLAKDALLVTAAGAEVIPFIKVWGILPGALVITYIYSRLNNRLSRERVFYSMIGLFLACFVLFIAIYPFRDVLHPHTTANYLEQVLPAGFKGLISMFRYWTFSVFYIMSELWSSAILSMLFWGFTNEVTPIGEAKRFYGLIAIGLNLAAVNGGQVTYFLTGQYVRTHLHLVSDPWYQSMILITGMILLSGAMIIALYHYLTRHVLSHAKHGATTPQKPEKIKMSMRENFAYLAKSKYLLSIAVVVLAYNVIINLVEVIWKDQVRQLYPDPNAFTAYMSQVASITGLISFALSLLVSGQLIRRYGWTVGALFTPVVLLITTAGFFYFFFDGQASIGVLAALGTSPLTLAVFFGSAQNCLSRASKFTFFDTTKEMAFIPLNLESKLKGKAAIDGVGSRLGKSAGSLVHQGLLLIFATIGASAHIVALLLIAFIGLWIGTVLSLGRQFKTLTGKEETVTAAQPLVEESVSAGV